LSLVSLQKLDLNVRFHSRRVSYRIQYSKRSGQE
jgi:hypothetical protein